MFCVNYKIYRFGFIDFWNKKILINVRHRFNNEIIIIQIMSLMSVFELKMNRIAIRMMNKFLFLRETESFLFNEKGQNPKMNRKL